MPYALCPIALCPMPNAPCPMPYVLSPMPYTLCPMPYTLRLGPYVLDPMPFTLCPERVSLHPLPSTLHPTLHPTPYTLHPTPYPTPQTLKCNARNGRVCEAHVTIPKYFTNIALPPGTIPEFSATFGANKKVGDTISTAMDLRSARRGVLRYAYVGGGVTEIRVWGAALSGQDTRRGPTQRSCMLLPLSAYAPDMPLCHKLYAPTATCLCPRYDPTPPL
eukprot:3941954-Rhodomonas_salina.1